MFRDQWAERAGVHFPTVKKPEDILETPEFDDLLQERHGISQGTSFPTTVKPDPDLEAPENLETWLQQVVTTIAD